MDPEVRRLDWYANSLLSDRRPSREMLYSEHGLHARQAAALMSGIRPGAGIPSRRLLTRLARAIALWIWAGTRRPISPTRIGPRPALLSGLSGGVSPVLNRAGPPL